MRKMIRGDDEGYCVEPISAFEPSDEFIEEGRIEDLKRKEAALAEIRALRKRREGETDDEAEEIKQLYLRFEENYSNNSVRASNTCSLPM